MKDLKDVLLWRDKWDVCFMVYTIIFAIGFIIVYSFLPYFYSHGK